MQLLGKRARFCRSNKLPGGHRLLVPGLHFAWGWQRMPEGVASTPTSWLSETEPDLARAVLARPTRI